MSMFQGAWPALLTPFTADDQVNLPKTCLYHPLSARLFFATSQSVSKSLGFTHYFSIGVLALVLAISKSTNY